MYKEHKIAIVIPAYNEEELILDTLCGMPDYVDTMYVVEDCSTDNTLSVIQKRQEEDPRIETDVTCTRCELRYTLKNEQVTPLD